MFARLFGGAPQEITASKMVIPQERKEPMSTHISLREHQKPAISYRPRFTAFLVPLLALASYMLMPMALAHAASCHVYSVNLQGITTIGDANYTLAAQQFSVSQYAIWRDAGYATHQYEFWLATFQDLNASPQVGYIELMTNSVFARNPGMASARFDLATVSVANGAVMFQMDPAMSFHLPPPNVFIAPGYGSVPGGLGGLCFLPGGGGGLCDLVSGAPILSVSYLVPRTGGGYFYLPDNRSIAGEVDLIGTGIDNTSFQGRYQAQFSGTYLSSVQCD